MKNLAALTFASLLSILLMTFHLTDDILHHGMIPIEFIASVLIPVVWLYGALVLTGRPGGYIIVALGSLLALLIPVTHIVGAGGVVSSGMAKSGDPFFFVWTVMALSITAILSLVLSLLGLWGLPRR